MAVLTDFTTFGDVRAALGVSEDELEDSTLSLDVYVFGLLSEFDDMNPSPLASYQDLAEADPETMEEVEFKLYRAVRRFSTYAVAKELLSALPMFGPKEISDGKASTVRFTQDPYKETIKRVEGAYEKTKQQLEAAYALFSSASTATVARPFMGVVTRGVDPVTGT